MIVFILKLIKTLIIMSILNMNKWMIKKYNWKMDKLFIKYYKLFRKGILNMNNWFRNICHSHTTNKSCRYNRKYYGFMLQYGVLLI